MNKKQRTAVVNGLRRGLVFGVAFILVSALLKYGSQSSDGYTVTASYTLIVVTGFAVFFATFLVKTLYDLYHTRPQYRRRPPNRD